MMYRARNFEMGLESRSNIGWAVVETNKSIELLGFKETFSALKLTSRHQKRQD